MHTYGIWGNYNRQGWYRSLFGGCWPWRDLGSPLVWELSIIDPNYTYFIKAGWRRWTYTVMEFAVCISTFENREMGKYKAILCKLVHGGPSHTWPISSRCFHVDRTRQGWACLDIWEGGLSVHKNALYTYSSKWGSKQEELKNETWCNKWMMRWKAYA